MVARAGPGACGFSPPLSCGTLAGLSPSHTRGEKTEVVSLVAQTHHPDSSLVLEGDDK